MRTNDLNLEFLSLLKITNDEIVNGNPRLDIAKSPKKYFFETFLENNVKNNYHT